MLILLVSLAFAQELPATVCDDDTQLCVVHRDRMAILVGKAKTSDTFKVELLEAADKLDQLGLELDTVRQAYDTDTASMLTLETDLAASQLTVVAARRQRNTAYAIAGAVVAGAVAGVYIASR